MFTWKEFEALVDSWQGCEEKSKRKKLIANYLKPNLCSKLFQMTIEYRHRVLGRAAEKSLQEDLKETLKNADTALSILKCVINAEKSFTSINPLLGSEDFYKFLTHARYWSRFNGQEFYEMRRKEEQNFLIEFLSIFKPQHVDFLEKIFRNNIQDSYDDYPEFTDFESKIVKNLERSTAQALLQIFQKPFEIDSLWRETKHHSLKRQLMLENSQFQKDNEIQNELKKTANKAKENKGIQTNFYDAFRLITHYSQHSGPFLPTGEVKNLIKNKKAFIELLWDSGTTQPLNRRMAGTLEKMREYHQTMTETDQHLQLPQWWSEVMNNK